MLVVERALEEELDEVALQEALVLQRLRKLQQVAQHNLVARRTEAPVEVRTFKSSLALYRKMLSSKYKRPRLHLLKTAWLAGKEGTETPKLSTQYG